jgi:hypothetical protein
MDPDAAVRLYFEGSTAEPAHAPAEGPETFAKWVREYLTNYGYIGTSTHADLRSPARPDGIRAERGSRCSLARVVSACGGHHLVEQVQRQLALLDTGGQSLPHGLQPRGLLR